MLTGAPQCADPGWAWSGGAPTGKAAPCLVRLCIRGSWEAPLGWGDQGEASITPGSRKEGCQGEERIPQTLSSADERRASSSPASASSACLWEVRMSGAWPQPWLPGSSGSLCGKILRTESPLYTNKFCSESTLIMSDLFVSPTKLA